MLTVDLPKSKQIGYCSVLGRGTQLTQSNSDPPTIDTASLMFVVWCCMMRLQMSTKYLNVVLETLNDAGSSAHIGSAASLQTNARTTCLVARLLGNTTAWGWYTGCWYAVFCSSASLSHCCDTKSLKCSHMLFNTQHAFMTIGQFFMFWRVYN